MESPEKNALSDGSFRLGLATVSQLALHPEFTEELAALIRRDGGPERAVRALRREFFGADPELFHTITIPEDATAEGLIAEAEIEFKASGIPFSSFDESAISLIYRDLKSVKGKTLQVSTYNFGRLWTTSEGRKLQEEWGIDGNAAAFLAWLTQTKKMGCSVSFANEDVRRDQDGLTGPHRISSFRHEARVREFKQLGIRGEMTESCLLVSFREAA